MGRGAEGWRAVTRVLRSCGGFVRTGVNDLAALMMPSECRLCGGPVLVVGTVRVCEDCLARLGARSVSRDEVYCARCGEALGFESLRFAEARGGACTMCRLAQPQFERAVAGGDYDDEMRELLHLLKFEGRRGLAELLLGKRLAEGVALLREAAGAELVVVPVPLFKARERERGYNQALLLAQAAVTRLKKSEPTWRLRVETGALVRVRDTQPLYALDPKQRRESVRGAFETTGTGRFAGHEVLLIDDILTTGATARECAKVLRRAGATKVWVATAARAQSVMQPPERDVSIFFPMSSLQRLVEPDEKRRRGFGW